MVEYKNKGDLFDEIDRILSEETTQKFGVGQSLYYQLPFFCEPSIVIPDWCWNMIEDYYLIKNYNIPLSRDLASADVWIIDSFLIIENELNNIKKHKANSDGS